MKSHIRLTLTDRHLRLEDYPGAINVVELEGRPITRCAHLALHRVDLDFAGRCLKVVTEATERYTVAIEAAWRSALLHYCKCFGGAQSDKGRSQLSANRIFGAESTPAMKCHRRMMALRNTHLVHDDGTHTLCAIGAAIAPAGQPRKVQQIGLVAMDTISLDDKSLAVLVDLVADALVWVEKEIETMRLEIAMALEQQRTHSELATKKRLGVEYNKDKGKGAKKR